MGRFEIVHPRGAEAALFPGTPPGRPPGDPESAFRSRRALRHAPNRESPRHLQEVAHFKGESERKNGALTVRIYNIRRFSCIAISII